MNSGTSPADWIELYEEGHHVNGDVIGEAPITIYINGLELATFMATPQEQDLLALGFLKNERLIADFSEIEVLYISRAGCCVDIWLNHPFENPDRFVITSGCGGGVTFNNSLTGIDPLESNLQIKPELIQLMFRKLQPPNSLYAKSRGVHAAGLLDPISENLVAIVEDVGRHNTIDKLTGYCLVNDIDTHGKVLLVTGRMSSEMIQKAALMGCPITASRTSPTSLSIEMAKKWNITLVGYVRNQRMRIYSNPQRLGLHKMND